MTHSEAFPHADTVLSAKRWADIGLDKGKSEPGPASRNAFITECT